MIKVLHISTECYPAAKAGGMGDVVGALPLYSEEHGINASVVIPKYATKWFKDASFKSLHRGRFILGAEKVKYSVKCLEKPKLGYPFFCIDIPGKFDRDSIYLDIDGEGYKDEIQRNISFQIALLDWIKSDPEKFDVIHCHDHMTGLIPFFLKYGLAYESLRNMASYFSIHNGMYKGMILWMHENLLPEYDSNHRGLLDWDNHIHSLASAVRCSWGFNTVSPGYLTELQNTHENLNWLYNHEKHKSKGILNGIDDKLWNPRTDSYLRFTLKRSWKKFKADNKSQLIQEYNLKDQGPLFCFIGRLANQKGADILADATRKVLKSGKEANFIYLGSGSREIEEEMQKLESEFPKQVKTLIMYNEGIAHQLYASSDFLIMPSRFEPCGLNQMFAMRYSTIPVVRSTGGLIDTVPDIKNGGLGIRFEESSSADLQMAIERGIDLYENESKFTDIQKKVRRQNFSWNKSMKSYAKEYQKILKLKS